MSGQSTPTKVSFKDIQKRKFDKTEQQSPEIPDQKLRTIKDLRQGQNKGY